MYTCVITHLLVRGVAGKVFTSVICLELGDSTCGLLPPRAIANILEDLLPTSL